MINIHIKKAAQTNNRGLHLKEAEKEQTQSLQTKEKLKIRAEINAT